MQVTFQFFEVVTGIGRLQVRAAMHQLPAAHPIVGAYHTGPVAEGEHPLSVGIGEQFVVDQADAPIEHRPQQLAVVRLLLDGVAEELIGLVRDEQVHRHFLHADQEVAIRQVIHQGDLKGFVLRIGVRAHVAALHHQVHIGEALHHFLALGRGQWYAAVLGLLAFADDADLAVGGRHGLVRRGRGAKSRTLGACMRTKWQDETRGTGLATFVPVLWNTSGADMDSTAAS